MWTWMSGSFDFGAVADQTQPCSCKSLRGSVVDEDSQHQPRCHATGVSVVRKYDQIKKHTIFHAQRVISCNPRAICKLVGVDVTPSVVSWMLPTLQCHFSWYLMSGQVQHSRACQWYPRSGKAMILSPYQMLDLQKNRFPTMSTLHHFQDSNKCLINITSRGKKLSSSMISYIACLPSQFVDLMVEVHLGIDAVEKVTVGNVC